MLEHVDKVVPSLPYWHVESQDSLRLATPKA